MNKKFTDFELVAGIIRSDSVFITYVLHNWRHKLISFVLQNSGNQADGEDIVQSALITLWQNCCADIYRGGSLEAYYLQIGKNQWLEELRRRARRPDNTKDDLLNPKGDFSEPPDVENLALLIVKDQELQAMEEALLEMKSDCKTLLERFYINKEKLIDIATEAGVIYNTFKKRFNDCKQRLNQRTQELLSIIKKNNKDGK